MVKVVRLMVNQEDRTENLSPKVEMQAEIKELESLSWLPVENMSSILIRYVTPEGAISTLDTKCWTSSLSGCVQNW